MNGTGTLRYAMSFLPIARGSATLEYFYTITGAKSYKNPFVNPRRRNGGQVVIGDRYTNVVAMDLGKYFLFSIKYM